MVEIERVYSAGVCNISREEVSLRWRAGWFGSILTVGAEATFVLLAVPPVWRLTLFLPAALATSGFLQASLHFCANYGMRGVFNLSSKLGATSSVTDAELAKKDRAKALLILGLATLAGAVVAGLGFALS